MLMLNLIANTETKVICIFKYVYEYFVKCKYVKKRGLIFQKLIQYLSKRQCFSREKMRSQLKPTANLGYKPNKTIILLYNNSLMFVFLKKFSF